MKRKKRKFKRRPETNEENLVKFVVTGQIQSPQRFGDYDQNAEGRTFVVPGMGSINLNIDLGSKAFGWEADHVHPGVSISAFGAMINDEDWESESLMSYTCVGNLAKIVEHNSPVRNKLGLVIGKHGGINNVLIYFDYNVKTNLVIGDQIQIEAYGQGLKFVNYPEIFCYNLDPWLIDPLNIEENTVLKRIEIPVRTIIPGELLGSGRGDNRTYISDFDIETQDNEKIIKYGIDKLRLGDIVAWDNIDVRYGPHYQTGAISIGVVVHGNCLQPGHGPGVVFILTSKNKNKLFIRKSKTANIAEPFYSYLKEFS